MKGDDWDIFIVTHSDFCILSSDFLKKRRERCFKLKVMSWKLEVMVCLWSRSALRHYRALPF